MTRVLTEGFEMRDLVGLTSTGSVETSVKRSGAASLKLDKTEYFYYPVSDLEEAYIRIGLYLVGSGSTKVFTMQWRHGSTVLGGIKIDLNAGSLVQAQVSTTTQDSGAIPLSESVWYLIEVHVKIDDAAGAIEVKVDGVDDATFSGDTKPGADAHFDNLYFLSSGGGLSATMSVYLDDLGINDIAGGSDDSWLGDGRIIIIKPNADTATLDLTPSAAVDHYTLVDEVPADSDTTYVEGSVDDEEDLYDLEACGLSDVIITRIWTEARVKDTASSGKSVALITLASGGAEVSGGDVTLAGTYSVKVKGAEQTVNPVDAAAWEVADIDALQGGPRTRP